MPRKGQARDWWASGWRHRGAERDVEAGEPFLVPDPGGPGCPGARVQHPHGAPPHSLVCRRAGVQMGGLRRTAKGMGIDGQGQDPCGLVRHMREALPPPHRRTPLTDGRPPCPARSGVTNQGSSVSRIRRGGLRPRSCSDRPAGATRGRRPASPGGPWTQGQDTEPVQRVKGPWSLEQRGQFR